MNIGDVVGMTSAQVHAGGKKDWSRVTFNANRGSRMVFLFLGTEEIDGEPLDPVKRIQQLGWSNPEFPTHVEMDVS
jgi:hypothetical protein